jgi:hypothetical protein
MPLNLRCGVGRDGQILAGTGFTVAKVSVGHYRVTYAPDPFGGGFAVPVVTAFEGNAGSQVAYIHVVRGDFFEVRFFDRTTVAPTLIDAQFSFHVISSALGVPTAPMAATAAAESSEPDPLSAPGS